MENENKTLHEVIYGDVSKSSGTSGGGTSGNFPTNVTSFNTFLTIYSINLAHRFPDVTDLNTIPYGTVLQIAEFAAACSSVALEAWQQVSQPTSDISRRQMLSRQKRAA